MPPRSLLQSSSSVLHLPGCWPFPLPLSLLSLLFLSFLPLFFCHHPCYSLPFGHIYSRSLSSLHLSSCRIYLPLVPPSFSTVTFSPVTFLHVMFSVVLSPFVFLAMTLPPLSLLYSSVLSLHCSFRPLSIPFVSLVILVSIPFIISVSLANSAVRQSTFQHPKHWNVNPSSVVSYQDFLHPDTAKSTKLWQWSHTKCLLAFTCRLQGAILRFLKINLVYTNLIFRKTVCLLFTATAAHFML